jgi:hypothetical protein
VIRIHAPLASTAVVLACVVLSSCGSSPSSPSDTTPRVSAIVPVAGSTLGGTAVTIAGANFSGVPTVTIGGAVARDVVVVNSGSITATTGQHAAGVGDLVVSVGGRSARLAAAFTYVEITNTPPVIDSLTAQGSRANEPSRFADLDEEIDVTASVTDAETTVDRLQFEWTAPAGTFSGTGAAVKWRAPASFETPGIVTLTLTVIETYTGLDGSGQPATMQNRAVGTLVVNVHASAGEIRDMATQFMTDFSRQRPVDVVLRNFMDCQGRTEEEGDVRNNQENYDITSYELGPATARVDFGGTCAFRSKKGDACAQVRARWVSTVKATGAVATTTGIDHLTAFYQRPRWWLCDSNFEGTNSLGLVFMR